MIRITTLAAASLIALTAALPARASDDIPDFLKVIGNFVKDGLGPARTAEDVMREERERMMGTTKAKPAPEPVAAVAPSSHQASKPEPEATAPALTPAAMPEPIPAPTPVKVAAVAPIAAPPPAPPKKIEVSLPVAPPPARPAEIKPKPIIVHQPPPPEPLISRIAATATLDQAMRLGGPANLYAQRIKLPARN